MSSMTPHAVHCRLLAVVVAAWLFPACAPPGDAIVSQCEGSALSVADAWHCTLTAARFDQARSASLTIESSRSRANVEARLELAKGTARVTLDELPGSSWTLTAGTTLTLTATDVPVGPTRRVTLTVTPSGGAVEGLTGTVDYKTP